MSETRKEFDRRVDEKEARAEVARDANVELPTSNPPTRVPQVRRTGGTRAWTGSLHSFFQSDRSRW